MFVISGLRDCSSQKKCREEEEHAAKIKLLNSMHTWQREEHEKKMQILDAILTKIEGSPRQSHVDRETGFSVMSSVTNLMNL